MSERGATVVACYGEILWDCLPRGIFLGGAPMNAAYHLARQGLRVLPVTAVGRDFLGDEALRRLGHWGLDPRFIRRDPSHPTGTVRARLDTRGIARYDIARGVAWDRIAAPPALRRVSPAPGAIIYGTLALRQTANRRTLEKLFAAWPRAWRVVDLNLRPPFDGDGVIKFALRSAHLVKLNDEELRRLTGDRHNGAAALNRAARRFAQQHGIPRICVTAGGHGAGLWWDGEWTWEPGRPVRVRDTVGAGDAFLAGLLGALLAHRAPAHRALAHGCRMGEFVASRDGATPDYRFDARGQPV